MFIYVKRSYTSLLLAVCLLFGLLTIWRTKSYESLRAVDPAIYLSGAASHLSGAANHFIKHGSAWRSLPVRYPVDSFRQLPSGAPKHLPRVQHKFAEESPEVKRQREERRTAVKKAFQKCWTSYREKAWMQDELSPILGRGIQNFGGWGATLVDSLDTLWIMGLRDEFEQAVSAAVKLDFNTPPPTMINLFETTIRHLGGFISAYDLSKDERLLQKATELGDMIYAAFDTPNRMPVTRWNGQEALQGKKQEASEYSLLAEIGSFTMEFTRLSQLTNDMKWFDAVQRITEIFAEQQMQTVLPGMWPVTVNAKDANFSNMGIYNFFSLSATADSMYEYLPKTFALLGGHDNTYRNMYKQAMHAAVKHILFRPMLPDNADVLVSGEAKVSEISVSLHPEGQHLGCFVGGMFALGGRLFNIPAHVDIGKRVTDGCIWTYKNTPHGIMPEKFTMTPCASKRGCKWDEAQYAAEISEQNTGERKPKLAPEIMKDLELPQGFTSAKDKRYILRPEAIESVFVLYRITGDKRFQESAWDMFTAIQKATETELANAALVDILVKGEPEKLDSMESFWLAETLKYFYLIFSEPDVISLDEYVFNTEAHPFKRPS